jgi:hypothetical protein
LGTKLSLWRVGMAVVVVTIGGFGPRTRGLALEAIAH